MTPEERKARRAEQLSANQKRLRAEKKTQLVEFEGVMIHPNAPHGTISGYNYWFCRCEMCKRAKKVNVLEGLNKKKAKKRR